METYVSRSGKKSGVTGYELGDTHIAVQFVKGTRYKYSYDSAGEDVIEHMKKLAINQEGLSTYIAQNEPRFESKFI